MMLVYQVVVLPDRLREATVAIKSGCCDATCYCAAVHVRRSYAHALCSCASTVYGQLRKGPWEQKAHCLKSKFVRPVKFIVKHVNILTKYP